MGISTRNAEEATDAPPSASNRLFRWMRSLELQRRPGWLGGVCAGVAGSIGVDVIIVRGVVVVAAVLGAPVALVYAIAWLLLPDEHDTLHAEQYARGSFDRAAAGMAALALISALPLAQGFWVVGASYWGVPDLASAVGRALWTGLALAAVVVVTVWLARRSRVQGGLATGTEDPSPAGPDADGPGTAGPEHAGPETAELGSTAGTVRPSAEDALDAPTLALPQTSYDVASPTAEPPVASAPPADASAEELALWREQQIAWKRERSRWASEQRRSERDRWLAAAQQSRLEHRAASRAIRDARRRNRPRLSTAFVGIAVGVAIIAGSAAALFDHPGSAGYEAAAGLAVATFVLGTAMVLAGLARRRSGALAFFALLSAFLMLATALLPAGRTPYLLGGAGISSIVSGRYTVLAGDVSMYLYDDPDDAPVTVDVWQAAGHFAIDVEPGQTLRIEAMTADHAVTLQQLDPVSGELTEVPVQSSGTGDGRSTSVVTVGSSNTPEVVVKLWQGRGRVSITERLDVTEDSSSEESAE